MDEVVVHVLEVHLACVPRIGFDLVSTKVLQNFLVFNQNAPRVVDVIRIIVEKSILRLLKVLWLVFVLSKFV